MRDKFPRGCIEADPSLTSEQDAPPGLSFYLNRDTLLRIITALEEWREKKSRPVEREQ